MKINITEENGKKSLDNLIKLTKENKYKKIEREIINEVFKEWKYLKRCLTLLWINYLF